jgi:hypothetical protein
LDEEEDEQQIPEHLKVVFDAAGEFRKAERLANQLANLITEIEVTKGYKAAFQAVYKATPPTTSKFLSTVRSLATHMRYLAPTKVCQTCIGEKCPDCKGRGFFTKEDEDAGGGR